MASSVLWFVGEPSRPSVEFRCSDCSKTLGTINAVVRASGPPGLDLICESCFECQLAKVRSGGMAEELHEGLHEGLPSA
jgi:hypothetical protein